MNTWISFVKRKGFRNKYFLIEVMKIVKNLYQLILPYHLRGQIKLIRFKLLRKLKILPLLRRIGILTCNSYLQVNTSNAEEVFGANNQHTKIYKIVEEDITKPAIYLKEQKLDEMQPFTVVTENVVLNTTNSIFSLRNNHLLDRNLNAIGGYRIEFEKLPIYYAQIPPTVSKLKGTVAYLSDNSPSNYYHWMCGTLPLLRFYQTFLNITDIDFFYIGQFPLSGFHKESLERAGIAMSKIVQESCTADRILAAISSRFINFNDPISREAYLFTRSLFRDECNAGKENEKNRIYVMRGNSTRRKVINEVEVINFLESYGFQAIEMDNKTVKEQAEIFSRAEAIVAPHGAALTNLLFAQSQATVIEIIPYGYINNCFYVLASYGNLNYFYLTSKNMHQNIDAQYIDLYVDIAQLENICQIAYLSR